MNVILATAGQAAFTFTRTNIWYEGRSLTGAKAHFLVYLPRSSSYSAYVQSTSANENTQTRGNIFQRFSKMLIFFVLISQQPQARVGLANLICRGQFPS